MVGSLQQNTAAAYGTGVGVVKKEPALPGAIVSYNLCCLEKNVAMLRKGKFANCHHTIQKAQPGRRGGAMSISALLSTNAEEPNPHPHHPPPPPPAATTNHASSNVRISPTAQRHHVVEKHLQRSPESTRTMPAKQVVNSRPVAAPTYTHTYDADATDSDHEPMYQPPGNKKSAAAANGFRDFKYHDSMQLDHNMDATDTDEDSDEFQAERIEYLKNVRKRQLELEEQEARKRKV
jgi:hypothetical protein